MELELGLALPDPDPTPWAGELGVRLDGMRGFGEVLALGGKRATLPLFGDGDGGGGGDRGAGDDCVTANKRKRLVGWPPVKCAHHRRSGGGAGYVKVKMEGVAIGRKVDVSLHDSYDELRRTLDRMFPWSSSPNRVAEEDGLAVGRRSRDPYLLTYEDGDGDWLLVGDVPWEAFAKSAKRLKILA